MRSRQRIALLLASSLLGSFLYPAQSFAASVPSTNSDAGSLCTQVVDNSTNVEVNRYGSDCVISFKRVGTTSWTIPSGVTRITALIVGGGGGGGFDVAGGGGAGGLLYFGNENPKTPNGSALTVSSGNISVTIGGGGAGATSLTTPDNSAATGRGINGSPSSITLPSAVTHTAFGGGGGNSRNNTGLGQDGGSGGGNGYGLGIYRAGGNGYGIGATLQGYGGGMLTGGYNGGAGGGGAGGVGANWVDSDTNSGAGGNGLQYSISGTPLYYAGGGGGGSWNQRGGPGGLGGGGAGGSINNTTCRANCATDVGARTGNAGTDNTGGGGGGSGNENTSVPGGAGGSGIVILRYTMSLNSTASLSMNVGLLQYKTATNISVVASSAGKVTFKANNKNIPGCQVKSVNSGNSYTAICSYSPALHGAVQITAVFTPSDSGYLSAISNSVTALIGKRTSTR